MDSTRGLSTILGHWIKLLVQSKLLNLDLTFVMYSICHMASTLESTTLMQIAIIPTTIPIARGLLRLLYIILELFYTLNLKCISFKVKGIGFFAVDVFIFP
jgi:hypothetical protein